MKVCSLYGAGYYYMPGTDICLKVGGYVRFQASAGVGNSPTSGLMGGQGGWTSRATTADYVTRTRAVASFDTRQQTAYGTLRTYLVVGFNHDTSGTATPNANVAGSLGNQLYANRGFIQIAGFTFGKATSFFDVWPNASYGYNVGQNWNPDTGESGWNVAAYTAQFGNGVSATISVEESRRRATINGVTAAGITLAATGVSLTAGQANRGGSAAAMPDFVANLRVDQAWGSVLVAGALHEVSGQYYGTNVVANGNPSDRWGWAATAGFTFHLPMIARGDRISAQFTYANGATRYASQTAQHAFQRSGNTLGLGVATDGIYGAAGSSVELTTAWSVVAGFEHLWTPALRTSIYGSYFSQSYNANARTLFCTSSNSVGGIGTGTAAAGCDPNWSAWTLGTRTQWEPVRGLLIGLDVMYSKLNSMKTATGNFTVPAIAGVNPAATVYQVADQSAWSGTFRIHRDILP